MIKNFIRILFCFLIISYPVLASIDTMDGTAVTNESNIDGFTNEIDDLNSIILSRSYIFWDTWNGATDTEDKWDAVIDDAEWAVVSNAAVFTSDAVNDGGYMRYDLPAEYDELYAEVQVKLSAEDLGAEGSVVTVLRIEDSANTPIIRILLWAKSGAGGNITSVRMYYLTDAGEAGGTVRDITFAVDTYNTVKIYYKRDTGGASQGIARSWVDGALLDDVTTVDNNDAVNQMDEIQVGAWTAAHTLENFTMTFDNLWVDSANH